MEWLAALVALLGIGGATPFLRRRAGTRRRERLRAAEVFRLNRHAAGEDVTRFGEELMDLHVETMTTDLDPAMREDYQRALDSYEDSKAALAAASTAEDVTLALRRLTDGRHAHACVLARRDGREPPQRRPPCFFDPSHGPASRDVTWAPPGGVERDIPVCFRDAERLAAGQVPAARMVRLGDRRVAWYAAGPAYQPWAAGWYDALVRDGRYDAERLTMMFVPGLAATGRLDMVLGAGAWSDPGGWSVDDLGVGHDPGDGPSFGGDRGGGLDAGGDSGVG